MFRDRVSVLIVRDQKVLGFYGVDPTNQSRHFFLPGGLIEPGESAAEAAIRETKEETGCEIVLLADTELLKRYDFQWNGQLNDCHTRFFVGRIVRERFAPVRDANYHQGVFWIGVDVVASLFAGRPEILEAVLELLPKAIEFSLPHAESHTKQD